MMKEFAHRGDPCCYCGKSHDEVAVGSCPAFTGEIRPPVFGERFVGYNGRPDIARFDFTVQKFCILREAVKGG